MPFQDAENDHFSSRTATAFALAPPAEIAFVQLNRTVKNFIGSQSQMMADDLADFAVEKDGRIGLDTQNIDSGTGGNFEYEKTEQFFLYFFFNLQYVSFIFRG